MFYNIINFSDKMLVLRANATHVDTQYWQAGKTSGEWEYFINSTLGSMIQSCLSLICIFFSCTKRCKECGRNLNYHSRLLCVIGIDCLESFTDKIELRQNFVRCVDCVRMRDHFFALITFTAQLV